MPRLLLIMLLLGLAAPAAAEDDPILQRLRPADTHLPPLPVNPLDLADYYFGRQDFSSAARIYSELAERGHPEAQAMLGLLHYDGLGVPRDFQQAADWYHKAAEQEHSWGQYRLGLVYDLGQGVPQDYGQAAAWYRKAAEQGVAEAQSNLGALYGDGRGVPQDYMMAHMWFNLAAAALPPGESRTIAVRNRDQAAARMTPEQIAEAQRLAREWLGQHRSAASQ